MRLSYNVAPNARGSISIPTLPFSPLTIPGCALWLDADDRLSIFPATGTDVFKWLDKSGYGRDFDSLNNPQYNYDTKSIDIVASSLQTFVGTVPLQRNYTAFFVATPNTAGPEKYFIGGDGGGSGPAIITNYTGNSIEYYNGADRATFTTSGSSPFLLCWVQTYSAYVIGFYNGSEIFSIANSVLANEINYIGSANNLVGFSSTSLREFIVYNSALSSENRQKIEQYLLTKWNIV